MSWNVIRPIGARILVKLDARREFYDAATKAILLPETARKQPETGRVVAIGPEAGPAWKIGTRVFFGKWNGIPCEPPEHDPQGEYYFLRAPLLTDKGKKLPVPVHGRTHMPVIDEVFAIIDDEGMTDDEVVTMTARDLPRARFSQR